MDTNLAVAVLVLPLAFILGLIDAAQDGYSVTLMIGVGLAMTLPSALAVALSTWCTRRLRTHQHWWVQGPMLGIVGLPLPLQVLWVLNGATNPDTAAHMRWVIVPIVLALFTLLLLGIPALILAFRKTGSNNTLQRMGAR